MNGCLHTGALKLGVVDGGGGMEGIELGTAACGIEGAACSQSVQSAYSAMYSGDGTVQCTVVTVM